jgi:hypothetical protein
MCLDGTRDASPRAVLPRYGRPRQTSSRLFQRAHRANFVIAGYGYSVAACLRSSGAITNASPHFERSRMRSARPKVRQARRHHAYTWLGIGHYAGEPSSARRRRPEVPVVGQLYGAPALTLKEFAGYRQDIIVGASLQVSVPWGQYDTSRIVNIGTNRWWFKPEVGVSKASGPWTLEVTAAATIFTDNTDFYGGSTRSQDPIYSFQGHAIYGFRSGIWASFDAAYFTGGRTTLDGTRSADLQQNWRLGGTLALPVDIHKSIKLYASSGVSARTAQQLT